MYAAVLGIISCVGAWMVWRRHPVYAPTATFRVVGEVLLLITASICVIAVTVNLVENRPFPVQVGVLITVIVFVTLAMIFSITALTTPKSAHLNTVLPANVPVVNLRRRAVTHWLKVAGIFGASCAAACAIPGATRYIAASVLGMLVLLASILLPTAYVMARKFDRAATALQLHPWLHWHYSAQEWQAWSVTRVERLAAQTASFGLKRDWHRSAWVGGGVVAAALIVTPGGWGARLGWAAFCIAMIICWVQLAAWEARRAPEKLRAHLMHVAPDAYFGDDGVLCDDRLLTWLGADVYLIAASLDQRAPHSLLMQFEKIVPNPYGPSQTLKLGQSVLIPAGSDTGDLALLRKALAARCPQATLAI